MTVVPSSLPDSDSLQGPQSPIACNYLPQYGFSSEYSFDRLIQDNPFLFRVYTPKVHSQNGSTVEPYFVGQKYNEHFTLAAEKLRSPVVGPDETIASTSSYQDVALHMEWTQRHKSPFISTTFSFIWAIWEATRRYRVGLKHDIEIAVIDSRMLAGRAATTLELLRKGTPRERHLDYWKWYRYALESQNVLVHGSIPAPAVLTSVPLLSLIDKLPSYFLRQECDGTKLSSPFDALSWDTMDRKPSFRQFCQDMSDQFLRLPTEHRLRDATGGSVRLAMAFLRPWFHKIVAKDFTNATETACTLAFIIAQWPAQWWSRDHVEMWSVIRSLVQAVAEEVREKRKSELTEEVRRLQGVVTNLERVVHDYEEAEVSSCIYPDTETEDGDYTLVLLPSPPASIRGHRSRKSATISGPAPAPVVPITCEVVPELSSTKTEEEDTPPCAETAVPPPAVKPSETRREEPSLPLESQPPESEESQKARSHLYIETASVIVTGILVGAFITLCIVNSTRRTLIYVT
ncbi:hypothetical protein EDD17DRAFT_280342 [Pisolithus thermaeus]|nr:hypothetical protein EV401DRAFT_1857934 [Pisolithus croceorrhizus]KAI6165313.1 hypothetical protein EDD17DRAFT_280342 [Pisolithus thermaeus]